MYHNSNRYADMDKENRTAAKFEELTVRITRARAKALGSSGGLPPQKPSLKRDQKKVPTNAKRAVSDENQSAVGVLQSKKRAVLKEVTNILCDNSYLKCQVRLLSQFW